MKIAAIYLAGGNSTRMGGSSSKLALPVGTKTLGSIALSTILQSSLETVFVIVQQSDDVQWLSKEIKTNPKCTIVHCPTAHKGQSETIRCGLKKAIEKKMDAVMIFLADQPFITIQMIEEIIACIRDSPDSRFVATTYDDVISPPILFTNKMFSSILQINGDRGARAFLKGEFLKLGKCLPCKDRRFLFDVDTQEDFQQFLTEQADDYS